MSTMIPMTPNAPFIASSPVDLVDADRDIRWVAIAPDEDDLLESLCEALAGKSAAILKTPAGSNVPTDQELQDFIGWSGETQIDKLVVVGTSRAGVFEGQDEGGSGLPSDAKAISDRLRAGASIRSVSNRMDQDGFMARVDQFLASPAIQDRCEDGSLTVSGLFYRSCDGIFLHYDSDARTLTPLIY